MADQNKFQKANQISSIAEEIRGGKREKPAILGGFDPISTENNNWAAANLGARAGAWYGGDGNGKKSNFFAIVADLILRFQPWHLFLGGVCMLKWHLWAEVRVIQQEVALDVRSSHHFQQHCRNKARLPCFFFSFGFRASSEKLLSKFYKFFLFLGGKLFLLKFNYVANCIAI